MSHPWTGLRPRVGIQSQGIGCEHSKPHTVRLGKTDLECAERYPAQDRWQQQATEALL